MAHEAPLLLAVDDAQWLDAASAGLIEFAARRVGEARIGLLVARRSSGKHAPPLGLDRAYGDSLGVISVGPLSLGALHRLVRDRLSLSLTRPSLRRISDVSAGNPFFALELARAFQEREVDHAGEPLPLPETLRETLGGRLNALPEGTREALVLAAASSEPTLELIGTALGVDADPLLEPAAASGIVLLSTVRVRFVHPLLASAVLDAATPAARRRAHQLLAAASSDLEVRARHLALASTPPDAEIAELLDAASRAARARGAPAAAAELTEQAIAQTPPENVDSRAARTVEAASALMIVGDGRRARSLLEEGVAAVDAGPLRAEMLSLLSELVAGDAQGGERRRALIDQSLDEARGDPRRRAEAFLRRDIWERSQNRLPEALASARAALPGGRESDQSI